VKQNNSKSNTPNPSKLNSNRSGPNISATPSRPVNNTKPTPTGRSSTNTPPVRKSARSEQSQNKPLNSKIGPNDPTQLNSNKAKTNLVSSASVSSKPNLPTYSGKTPDNEKKSKPLNSKKLWLWLSLGVLLIILSAGLFFYFRTASFVDKTLGAYSAPSLLTATVIPSPSVTAVATATPQPVANVALAPVATATPRPVPTATPTNYPALIQRIQRGERVTAMVLGYGGTGHDGAFLTDTILLLSYDPVRKAVSMVNMPRDFYTFIPYGGPKIGFWSKINAAFSYVMETTNPSQLSPRYRYTSDVNKIDAAANLTKDIVEEITGIPIDYWAVLNFNGFRRFIDAIGGVSVTVETTFDDYEYPANDNPEIDASVKHIHFEAGPQHMEGERAIEYARSRKSVQDGNDFGRSRRQMRLVQAVKDKALKPDVLFKALNIMDALQGNVRSSFTLNEIRGLVDYFRTNDGADKVNNLLFVSQILSSNFLYDSTSYDTGYILVPQAGQGNYKPIQEWLQQGLNEPGIRAENLRVQIQNSSGLWKYSNSTTESLRLKGFTVLQPLWANPVPTTTITDYSDGKAVNSLRVLNQLFPGATVKTLRRNSTSAVPDGPELLVTLGQDYPASLENPTSGKPSNKVEGNLIEK